MIFLIYNGELEIMIIAMISYKKAFEEKKYL